MLQDANESNMNDNSNTFTQVVFAGRKKRQALNIVENNFNKTNKMFVDFEDYLAEKDDLENIAASIGIIFLQLWHQYELHIE